jgi:hypothetical protein
VTIGRWLLALAAPLSALAPEPAFAGEPQGCPAGEWFCEDPAEPASADPPPRALPAEAAAPARAAPEPAEPPAPALEQGWTEGWNDPGVSPWALALRLQGVMLGGGSRHDDARLGGIGASLRYTLAPAVTLDLGLDSILGTDYVGRQRSELGLSFSSLLFLNQSQLVRTYVLVGLNTSSARVEVEGDEQSWGYFGGHAGLGLEFALDSYLGLSIDAVAFMRGRTDSRAAHEPEFTDGSGRVSNTSGGGLLRGGLVLRF